MDILFVDVAFNGSFPGLLKCIQSMFVNFQDWVVGKYGRVLPVVHVKKPGTKKVSFSSSKLEPN